MVGETRSGQVVKANPKYDWPEFVSGIKGLTLIKPCKSEVHVIFLCTMMKVKASATLNVQGKSTR
jgi:hypothetical protein